MKLSEWSAIAEIVGAAAIIGSLIFVGTEIQQNTSAIRTSTVQAIADQATTINLAYATDDRLAHIFMELSGETPLSDSEISRGDRLRLEMAIRAQLRRVENIYLHVQGGALEASALERVGYGWYTGSYVKGYWDLAKSGFDPEFADFMDKKISEAMRERQIR
jgi:hypothetical protein